ncbi:MAG: DUF92 domain-containing protein [Balneolaceae bacterium]|nr:DUF92 domain-containing protein [Balneolaceae bacterium]
MLFGKSGDHFQIISGFILASVFCLIALFLNLLTLDGAKSAGVLGTITYGLGGWGAAFLLLLFFISSSLISKKSVLKVEFHSHQYLEAVRRNGLQVWSNGFWFALFIVGAFMWDFQFFIMASLGALATAMADTWATELGSRRFKAKTYLISGLKKVDPGTDGGISIPGTFAAFTGSLIIALTAIYVFSFTLTNIFPILMAGFLGCLADSYFGAIWQQQDNPFTFPEFVPGQTLNISNNFVNWASTGVGSLIAIILNLVLI